MLKIKNDFFQTMNNSLFLKSSSMQILMIISRGMLIKSESMFKLPMKLLKVVESSQEVKFAFSNLVQDRT